MGKEIDFDVENSQKALRNLYAAIQNHQDFWSSWLANRTEPSAKLFASTEELQAATALGEALLAIVDSIDQ